MLVDECRGTACHFGPKLAQNMSRCHVHKVVVCAPTASGQAGPIAPGFTAGFLGFSLAPWIQQRVRPVGGGLQMDHNQNVMCSWEIPCVRRKPSALRHSGMVAEHGGPPIPWYSVERVEDDGMHFPPQEGIRCLQQQLAISTPSTLNGSSPTLWALCWAGTLRGAGLGLGRNAGGASAY